MYDRQAFQKMPLGRKLQLIRDDGESIASREHQTYHVHLFRYHNYYVEVWRKTGLNYIYWIDAVEDDTLEHYLDQIELVGLEKVLK